MGNQASSGGGVLLKLRQDLLHTTNSAKVLKEIDKLVTSGALPLTALQNGDDDAINILKYVARLHGLPNCFRSILSGLLVPGDKQPNDKVLNACFIYKASLALKYAVSHNSDFIPLSALLNILLTSYPLDHGTPQSNHGDFFREETISQLMLTILKVLNPDRVVVEKIDEGLLWKLENYLAHINGRYKSEVRRSLEKMGYWSGSVVSRGRGLGRKALESGPGYPKSRKSALVQTGEQVIASMQTKKGLNVSAHVVKTQQTEAVTTEENVSEKTQMSNISLSNALEQGRARTLEAARARETLPETKTASGSDRWWFKTTSWEVNNFLAKAKGEGAISPDDVQYLRNKFDGYKFSFTQGDTAIVKMIAETFYLISKFQKLTTELVLELLGVVTSTKFKSDEARYHILQTVDRHCNRERSVPTKIREALETFLNSPEIDTPEVELINDILITNTADVKQILEASINALKGASVKGHTCVRYLNHIQRQFDNKSELENQVELVPTVLDTVVKFNNDHPVAEKALELLEDYLQLGWTTGFQPSQLTTLIGVATSAGSTDDMKRKSISCLLRSMEKGLEDEDYFGRFTEHELRTQFGFLFALITAEGSGRGLRVLTIVMLSRVLENPAVKHVGEMVTDNQVDALRKQLQRKDVLLKGEEGGWKVVEEEQLTDKFFNDDGPKAEEFEFVSNFVAKLLLVLVTVKPERVVNEMTISTCSQLLLSSKGKMTKILCSEFLFRAVSSSAVGVGVYFSPPVLNRIQGEVFSSIGDVHVYITAAYCTSLSNQAQAGLVPLEVEHVNFLVNLYAFKKVTLDKEDFSQWINPKILQVFQLACKKGTDISEQVFHLMALVLNNTCADSEQSPDYPIVKVILDMVTLYCNQHKFQATTLPPSMVEAVENLLLESDVFDETCAGIIELCMVAGRWVSEAVVEEFAKYLWHEPHVSIPMLRRLSIANENQELSDPIFVSFQMELIGLRLYPTEIHPSGITVLTHQQLGNETGEPSGLFQCLEAFVSGGSLISKLNLDVISRLLQRWGGKEFRAQKENVIRCLTCAAFNGQSLPRELVEHSLKGAEDGGAVDFITQLEFATAVVMRGQQLPDPFLGCVYKRLNIASDLTRSDKGKKVLELMKTMILHNQQLPEHVAQRYCATVLKHKETMTTPDVLSSLMRLVENGHVSTGEGLETCKQAFLFALDTENHTLEHLGAQSLYSLPESAMDPTTKAKLADKGFSSKEALTLSLSSTISTTAIPTKDKLLQLVKSCIIAGEQVRDWQTKWTPVWKAQLEAAFLSDVLFLEKVVKMLKEGNGALSACEEMIVETLAAAMASSKDSSKDEQEMSRKIIEYLVSERKCSLSESARSYLLSSSHNQSKRWAWELLVKKEGKIITTTNAAGEEKKKKTLLGRFFGSNNTKKEAKRGGGGGGKVGVAEEIVSQHRAGIRLEIGTEDVEALEEEILNGDGVIPPVILEAYYLALALLRRTTSKWRDVGLNLAQYLKNNVSTLGWAEKRHILSTFNHFASTEDPLPQPLLDLVTEGVFHERDALLRGLCFQILLTLRKRKSSHWDQTLKETVWLPSFYENLYTVYEKAVGGVDEEDLEENMYTLNLVHVLQTLSAVDLKGLSKQREKDWAIHLMAADTVLPLAKSVGEELDLYPVAKDFSSHFEQTPLNRLYVLNAIKDYVALHKGTGSSLSPARLLQLLNLTTTTTTRDSRKGKQMAAAGSCSILEPCDPTWIQQVICSGFTSLLGEQLHVNNNFKIIEVVIQQFINSTQVPKAVQLLDSLTTILSRAADNGQPQRTTKSNIYEFMELLDFVKKNPSPKDQKTMGEHLKQLVVAQVVGLTVKELLASLQTSLLMSSAFSSAGAVHEDKIRRLESHTRGLLTRAYDFPLLRKLFKKVEKGLSEKVIQPNMALTILENILYQLVGYHVRADRFPQLYAQLKETKKFSEWIGVCNNVVMEQLYSGSQGVKTSTAIADEFTRTNTGGGIQEEKLPDYLSEFHDLVHRIQEGSFRSCLGISEKLIAEWEPETIGTWARKAKSATGKQWGAEMVMEALAVISRTCSLKRNYRLTPIQILSVYSTILPEERKGILLQVATGSGKSTIIVALAIIRKLMGSPVDIYTSSPVLAERDAKAWAPFYQVFHLSVDHNGDKGSGYTKGEKSCYKKDIVYGDTSQFQFDALRHEYSGLGTRAGRAYGYAIVDEVDSMFVDDSSKLARLSSTLPGMDLLQIVYHLMWQRLHDIQQRLYAVGKGTYYLEGARSVDENGNMYYTFANQKSGGKEETKQNVQFFILQNQNNAEELENALIFKVEQIDSFVVEHLKKYTRALIGEEEFKENGRKIEKLALPKFLIKFAKSQVNNWVDSALTAVTFQENVHYVIDRDQIKPVDYNSTGIIQASTNWNNGLHQFLQIKHSLKVSTETVTTNFLSNMAIFQKYGPDLVGFTGTLGSPFGQNILKEVYNVQTLIIPELYYKRFQLLGEHVLSQREVWAEKVVHSALHESAKGRAVLVICQTIKDAELIAELLEAQNLSQGGTKTSASVKLYTRNDLSQEKHVQQVYEGDVIVATNLAGRGTDINTRKVEAGGGLHVILTFLPDSLRVEEQAFGRTARQGNKGSGELILLSGGASSCKELKAARDEAEQTRLNNFRNKELTLIQTKDELFSKFCSTYSKIRNEMKSSVKEALGLESLTPLEQTRLQAIEQQWAMFLKRVDDGQLKLEDAKDEYNVFESGILATYKDEEKTINACDNCYYWVQFGNDFYRRKNITNDDTGGALEYFQKGIQADPDFAAGAHAGIGFCILKGKSHWIGKNSQTDGYKTKAIQHLKRAIKILYTEIGLWTTAQTLAQHRGGRTDSELFTQLTEKINLIGEFSKCIEVVIETVEKSLRRVYLQEANSNTEVEKQWRLDDDNPKISGYSSSSSTFSLEFHDLTFRYDCGTQDQAIETVREFSNVTISLHNQNLDNLLEVTKRKKLSSVQLFGLQSAQGINQLLGAMEVKESFTLGIASHRKTVLAELGKVVSGRRAELLWHTDEGETQHKKMYKIGDPLPKEIPDDADVDIEIEFKRDEISVLESVQGRLGNELDLYIILKELTKDQIKKAWTIPNKKEGEKAEPGLLQAFTRNKVTFLRRDNKKAKEIISALRDKNISFELKLENLRYSEAVDALSNSGRAQENIEEKAVKEMGSQFSSTYIPLEAIRDLVQRGLVLMPEFGERAFVPWRSVISISILASVQVAAGGLLICTGFGATLGMGLITEGMSDFTTAYRAYSSRQFSWQDYAIQKAISLTISAVSMGLSSLKDGAKGVQTVVEGAVTEVVEQAGQKVATEAGKKTLNEGIKIAGDNLRALAVKQIAVKGCETVARVGLNTVMDSLVQFSFESVKENLSREVETTVSREFKLPKFTDALRIVQAVDRALLQSKIFGWMNEVTNPQSGNWNKAWDSVGYPLINGILSDPQYLGSSFSMATRLIGVINGCREIGTVTCRVTEHIRQKLEAEVKSLTPSYLIQEDFGVSSAEAENILENMQFGRDSPFHVKKFPDKCSVDLEKLKSRFEQVHKDIVGFKSSSSAELSRIIKSVMDHLTNHIIHVANRQLVAPVTTAAVGKLVASISQEIQSKYLVNDSQLSEDQQKVRKLKEKDPSQLTSEEKAFLQRNDRPLTIAEQIRGNAKDYTVAYQKRDIIAVISTISEEEKNHKNGQKMPENFSKASMGAITNILGGGAADMTTVFLMAQLNNVDVKLVDDPSYEPTEEDKEKGLKIIVWEKPEEGQPIGHYTVKDAKTGQVTDFVGGGQNDCAYNVMASITGKSPHDLRLQSAAFVAYNQDKFGRINESANWIRERYPEDANNLLHVGGRRVPTNFKGNTDDRHVIRIRKNVNESEEEEDGENQGEEQSENREESESLRKFVVERAITLEYSPGVGSTPARDAEVTIDAKELTAILGSDETFVMETADGERINLTGSELKEMLGKRVVAGHVGTMVLGTRGTDNNMVAMSNSLNQKMSKNFEERCKEFLREAVSQGLITEGDKPLGQHFYVGPINYVEVPTGSGDIRRIPLVSNITCTAYLNDLPREGANMNELRKLFENTLQGPDHRALDEIRGTNGDVIAYGTTFTNTKGSQMVEMQGPISHTNPETGRPHDEETVCSSSQNEEYEK